MNKPLSRRKRVIPGASEEPKLATDSAAENTSEQDNPASATITVTAVEVTELTQEEQSLRLHLEHRVERAFLEAGQALMELRDRRLYRSTHQTFEEYCRVRPWRWRSHRFNYSRDAAYLKISATVVYENLQKFLPTIGRQIPMPTNERQLRFLAKAELEPAVQADVWQQAVEQAGNKIPSGRIVKDVVDRIRESPKGKYPILTTLGRYAFFCPKIIQT
ncbi:hypothetical protein [Nostoc sp. ATCC 53789]|uniref:hypothetical protein n=1 Tax=Nostoc sp. ATCC 53789 TaxID=76335 RepID=UPI001FD7B7FD|nr:hypothetical protein [Nostoc sp. ATCC 53789]